LADSILDESWRIKFFTDSRGVKFSNEFHPKIELIKVSSSTFFGNNLIKILKGILNLFSGSCSAFYKMLIDRPQVVAGFGGYPALPTMLAATILRIPILIHEQNGVLGRVNQLFARRSSIIACGIWPIKIPEGIEAVKCGNPVRHSIMGLRNSPYIPPGDYPINIVILGGSQGAKILSEIVPSALNLLSQNIIKNLQITHQARKEDISKVTDFYNNCEINADVSDFFNDIPKKINEAQLIISRAGASTIAEISIIGRPSILIPLKVAIRDEQTSNAMSLVAAKAAILISEDRLTALELKNKIEKLILNPALSSNMAKAAYENSNIDATKKLTKLVVSLASNKTSKEIL
jgi:UDP-N-acetylglucosamine--N-acetylmuramyl-(pentapeptide) pyrophosphoryl-undecaprenol N-acetylglucosamine transferase